MHSQAVNRPDLRSTISRLEEAEDDISRSERLIETASGGWFPAVRHFVFGEGMAEAAVPDAYPVEFDRAALPEGFPYRVKLVRHPARNRTRSWAGFPATLSSLTGVSPLHPLPCPAKIPLQA